MVRGCVIVQKLRFFLMKKNLCDSFEADFEEGLAMIFYNFQPISLSKLRLLFLLKLTDSLWIFTDIIISQSDFSLI